ncbi:MAG: hypothetical protein OEW72_04975 [Gammaproteobacteria bacterium]|nr:hypothetical protein [Gammaproteobacteria bacterium]
MKNWPGLLALVLMVPVAVGAQVPAAGGSGPSPADAPGSTEAASRIAQREFRDQYGNLDSLARRGGAPVVVVVVSVRRLAMIEKWERDLSERVPGIRFLNVADLPADVPVDLERTAQTIRKRVPPAVNVLMDPSREWATTFALDTELPNLLVFDAGSQLIARFRGRWTAALAGEVAAAMPGRQATP